METQNFLNQESSSKYISRLFIFPFSPLESPLKRNTYPATTFSTVTIKPPRLNAFLHTHLWEKIHQKTPEIYIFFHHHTCKASKTELEAM